MYQNSLSNATETEGSHEAGWAGQQSSDLEVTVTSALSLSHTLFCVPSGQNHREHFFVHKIKRKIPVQIRGTNQKGCEKNEKDDEL